MFKAIALWQHSRQAVRELSLLSDRELSDIGIIRGDIETIVRATPEVSREDAHSAGKPRGGLMGLGLARA